MQLKKNNFFILIFIFSFGIAKAQMRGVITYRITVLDLAINQSFTHTDELYFTKKKSIQIFKDSNVSSRQIDENTEIKVVKTKKPAFLLKNFSDERIFLTDNISGAKYYVVDTLQNFNWKLTKEKKKIQNYLCTKATTQFRGRNYEAWYAESIPIQNGPWKFCGLPGLIIKVADDENKFVYELAGIDLKAKFDEKLIAVPKEYTKDKPITHKQFMALYKKKVEDYAKLSKVVHTDKNGSYGTVSIILPEKMEKY